MQGSSLLRKKIHSINKLNGVHLYK